MSGSLEALDYLLSNGANWRMMDSEGNNLVQLAALYFHTDILRRLIRLNLEGLPVWRILVGMLHDPTFVPSNDYDYFCTSVSNF